MTDTPSKQLGIDTRALLVREINLLVTATAEIEAQAPAATSSQSSRLLSFARSQLRGKGKDGASLHAAGEGGIWRLNTIEWFAPMRTHRRRRATRLVASHQQSSAPMRRLENIGAFTVACALVLLILFLLLEMF